LNRNICLLLILLGFGWGAAGQSISASPYSVYGVGLLKSRNSAQNRAMAGTGIGTRDPLNLNTLNPASYPSIKTITQIFETGIFIERDRYKTRTHSSSASTGNLTTLSYWFRFSKKWGGTVGLAPFSKVNYSISSANNLGTNESSTVNFSGNGGLSEFYFGNGFQVTKNLSVGANMSYVFGTLEKTETIDSGIGAGTGVTNQIHGKRLTADVGAQYEFFLGETRSLSVGATYNPQFTLNTTRDITAHESNTTDTLWTKSPSQRDYTLPSRYGAGVSLQTQRTIYALDFTYAEWSKARLENGVKLRNTMRLSFGFEYKGSADADRYLENIQVRSGFYVDQNYLVLRNTSFTDWGVSAGLGLPVFENRGVISFSCQYNHAGTTSSNLIQQNATVFVLDFTFRDLWGIRRKFD